MKSNAPPLQNHPLDAFLYDHERKRLDFELNPYKADDSAIIILQATVNRQPFLCGWRLKKIALYKTEGVIYPFYTEHD